jgi:hypothetical protein
MIFNPGVELGPVDGSGWNFSPVCNRKLYQNQTRDHMTEWQNVQPRAGPSSTPGLKFDPASASRVDPGLNSALGWRKFLSCNRFNPGLKWFMSYSNMRGVVTIYYKKTKWRLWSNRFFYFQESMPGTHSISTRGWNRPCNRKTFQPG